MHERTNARYLNKPEKRIYLKKPKLKKTDENQFFLKKHWHGSRGGGEPRAARRSGGGGGGGSGAGLVSAGGSGAALYKGAPGWSPARVRPKVGFVFFK